MQDVDRQKVEREFYEQFYESGWEKENASIHEDLLPANLRVYWNLVKEHIELIMRRQSHALVLDCGCGNGVLSVLLAKTGAKVLAVDISANGIKIARRLADSNGVGRQVLTVVAALENLPFKRGVFDCVLGTRILHHADIMDSGMSIYDALKGGGNGVFWEGTERNPLLRFARNHVRGVLSLPKFGTAYEHPLTKDEIKDLKMIFKNPVTFVDAPFFFFNFLDKFLFRQRLKWVTRLVARLDSSVAKYLPYLNRYSFHQILILNKHDAGNESERPGQLEVINEG